MTRLANGVRRLRTATRNARFPEGASPDEHWQRQVLNREVDRYLSSMEVGRLSAAEISGGAQGGRAWKRFVRLDYPEFDLCAPLETSEEFDVVICEQVIEHVDDPWLAAANLRGLSRPGGHVIVSTPFLIRVHELPAYGMKDYWRFTPRGLRTLLERVGLEVQEVGSWGNRSCVLANLDHWPAYRPWHSLRNETDIPLQVWAFARNPIEYPST